MRLREPRPFSTPGERASAHRRRDHRRGHDILDPRAPGSGRRPGAGNLAGTAPAPARLPVPGRVCTRCCPRRDRGKSARWHPLPQPLSSPRSADSTPHRPAPAPGKPARSAASATRSTLAPAPLVPVEKDSIATRATPKSASAERAEASAISASCAASGATFTAQSANTISRPSGNSITKNDDGTVIPSSGPIAIAAASITRRVGESAPATMPSASPAATIAAARYSGLANNRRAIASFMPRAATSAATCASDTSANPTGTHSPSAPSRAAASATRGSSSSGKTSRASRPRACSYIRSMNSMPAPSFPERRPQ